MIEDRVIDDLVDMREDAEASVSTQRDLDRGIEWIDRYTGEDALVSVADVDREIRATYPEMLVRLGRMNRLLPYPSVLSRDRSRSNRQLRPAKIS